MSDGEDLAILAGRADFVLKSMAGLSTTQLAAVSVKLEAQFRINAMAAFVVKRLAVAALFPDVEVTNLLGRRTSPSE